MAEPFRISIGSGVSDYIVKLNGIPKAGKEVFLWELVRNAKKALLKLRLKTMYETYRDGDGGKKDLFIDIIPDKVNKTLSIVDNGVGMTEGDLKRLFTVPERALNKYMDIADLLVENRVTADQFYTPSSDTHGDTSDDDEELLDEDLREDDLSLGFFAAFMVADRIEITTKHCNVDACPWFISGDTSVFSCDVRSSSSGALARRPWGTRVTLFLKEDHFHYLDVRKLKVLINKYPLQLCPYPINIRGVRRSGEKRTVRHRRADVDDDKTDIKSLENQFQNLRKLFEEVLVGRSPGLEQVVFSDHYFDLPAFLTPDKKTLIINPRNWIMKRLKEAADRNLVVDAIKLRYMVCESILKMYEQKSESFCRL